MILYSIIDSFCVHKAHIQFLNDICGVFKTYFILYGFFIYYFYGGLFLFLTIVNTITNISRDPLRCSYFDSRKTLRVYKS